MTNLKLPKNWGEISIKRFNELREIDDNTSTFMKQVLIISTLLDIDPTDKEIEEMDILDLVKMLSNLKFLSEKPSDKIKNDIGCYKIIDINNLSLGEFIDLDYYISEDPLKNLAKIAAILYRNYKYDEYHNIDYEKYGVYNIDERSNNFEDISIDDTFGLINHFISFKMKVYNNYINIFNPILNEEDLDPEDLDDPETLKEIEKEKKQAQWSWEIMLYKLSNGDVTKYDSILNLPIIFIMNQLSFKKSFSLE